MNGKVKFFNQEKGFGFIKGEDDAEYFVHASGIINQEAITENDDVVFFAESKSIKTLEKLLSVTL